MDTEDLPGSEDSGRYYSEIGTPGTAALNEYANGSLIAQSAISTKNLWVLVAPQP